MCVLCILFGITGSVCFLFVRFGIRLLLKALKSEPLAMIRMPTMDEASSFKNAFISKYSILKKVFCVADCLQLYLEQSGNYIIQNLFYNGWKHDHYVSNVFVFSPNGVVVACAANALGAMHDSTVSEWGHVYKKLRRVTNCA